MNKKFLFFLFAVMTLSAVAGGIATGRIYRTLDKELVSDQTLGEGSALTAISLLETGRFGTDEKGYFGLLPRGPIYPILIAATFLILGKSIYAIWILNALLFYSALIILYALSQRLLPGKTSYIPPLFLALYWGATINIFIIQMEALALLLMASLLYFIFKYLDTHNLNILLVASCILGFFILTKPILLYFLPVAGVIIFIQNRFLLNKNQNILHVLIFIGIAYSIVGIWQYRNFVAIGSSELGRGGHVFLTRAKSAEFQGTDLKGFVLSTFVGDYITDLLLPGYANKPEPRSTVNEILRRWYGKNALGLPETKINELFWQEGITIAKAHPIQFVLVTPVWMMRFNNPVGHNVNDLDHLFVGTHNEFTQWQKITIIFGIRLVWYGFLCVVILGFIKIYKNILQRKNPQWNYWIWPLILIVYFNLIHAFFTFAHHRYVLPVLPFYYMLFAIYASNGIKIFFPHSYKK